MWKQRYHNSCLASTYKERFNMQTLEKPRIQISNTITIQDIENIIYGDRCNLPIEVTPTLAGQLLTMDKTARKVLNLANRPLQLSRVIRYATDIKKGQWADNGETLSISKEGMILSGQHRLYGVMKADTSVTFWFAFGIDKETFATLDTGKMRNGADVLAIKGLTNTKALAAIITAVYRWDGGHDFTTPYGQLTQAEVGQY